MIEKGTVAPDFTLKDHDNNEFHLAEKTGEKILLSFHPLGWTGICRDQMLSLESNYDRFKELNTIPFGVNVDSVPSKKAWANDMGLQKLRMLSDFWPHGEVAKLYGVFREAEGFAGRANIVIDEDKKVIFAETYPISQLPDIEEVIDFLKQT